MDKEAAERTAAVLARRALSLLDGVDAGGSIFACRLSEALDVAIPNATDMAPRSSMMELVAPSPHAAAPLATFGLADGQVVAINPATVSHLCSDDSATTIRFLDGSQVQLKVPYEKVVMGLGLSSESQPLANGFIPVDGARHVLRNLLTIVSATINQVLDGDEPLVEKGRELAARVAMLSRISDLIVQPEAHVTDLQTLVELALAEGGRSRVRIVGSPCADRTEHGGGPCARRPRARSTFTALRRVERKRRIRVITLGGQRHGPAAHLASMGRT